MAAPLRHELHGRNRRTIGALVVAVAFLGFLYSIGTTGWILTLLSVFALPALVDVIFNPLSTFEIDDDAIRWRSVTQVAAVGLDKVRQVRVDTRLDISIRVTLMLVDGSKMRIPQDVLPPRNTLETALADRDIPIERHHFRLF